MKRIVQPIVNRFEHNLEKYDDAVVFSMYTIHVLYKICKQDTRKT